MKISKHITFFYDEGRFKYLNQLIAEAGTYPHDVDIFIHTNKSISDDKLHSPSNNITILVYIHDLKGRDPYILPWLCRPIMESQKNHYDIFMYVEDDILVPRAALLYWLEHKNTVMAENYNLGFLRIEVDPMGKHYTTDNATSPDGSIDQTLRKTITINGKVYAVNDANPYCAFWIYDANEFSRFIYSGFYNPALINGYGIREKAAIGLHGLYTPWYTYTVIPVMDKGLNPGCKIYHLPNNYLYGAWKLHPFDEVFVSCDYRRDF